MPQLDPSLYFSSWLIDSITRRYLLHFTEVQWPSVAKYTILLGIEYFNSKLTKLESIDSLELLAHLISLEDFAPFFSCQQKPVNQSSSPASLLPLRNERRKKTNLVRVRRTAPKKKNTGIKTVSQLIDPGLPSSIIYLTIRRFLLRFPESQWPQILKLCLISGLQFLSFLGFRLHLIELDEIKQTARELTKKTDSRQIALKQGKRQHKKEQKQRNVILKGQQETFPLEWINGSNWIPIWKRIKESDDGNKTLPIYPSWYGDDDPISNRIERNRDEPIANRIERNRDEPIANRIERNRDEPIIHRVQRNREVNTLRKDPYHMTTSGKEKTNPRNITDEAINVERNKHRETVRDATKIGDEQGRAAKKRRRDEDGNQEETKSSSDVDQAIQGNKKWVVMKIRKRPMTSVSLMPCHRHAKKIDETTKDNRRAVEKKRIRGTAKSGTAKSGTDKKGIEDNRINKSGRVKAKPRLSESRDQISTESENQVEVNKDRMEVPTPRFGDQSPSKPTQHSLQTKNLAEDITARYGPTMIINRSNSNTSESEEEVHRVSSVSGGRFNKCQLTWINNIINTDEIEQMSVPVPIPLETERNQATEFQSPRKTEERKRKAKISQGSKLIDEERYETEIEDDVEAYWNIRRREIERIGEYNDYTSDSSVNQVEIEPIDKMIPEAERVWIESLRSQERVKRNIYQGINYSQWKSTYGRNLKIRKTENNVDNIRWKQEPKKQVVPYRNTEDQEPLRIVHGVDNQIGLSVSLFKALPKEFAGRRAKENEIATYCQYEKPQEKKYKEISLFD